MASTSQDANRKPYGAITNDSDLLDLPVELLQRITGFLDDEPLTALRLTCKTLEAATFDQFTKRYCTVRCCFVLDQEQWEKLELQFRQSPRLTSLTGALILTTDYWKGRGSSNLQLAPEKQYDNIQTAQCKAWRDANNTEGQLSWLRENEPPNFATMMSVMGLLRQSSTRTNTVVHVELVGHRTLGWDKSALCHDILTVITKHKFRLRELSISPAYIAGLETFFTSDRQLLLEAMSKLDSIYFGTGERFEKPHAESVPAERLGYLQDIVQSAPRVTSLKLRLQEYRSSRRSEPVVTTLLLGNSPPALSTLHLNDIIVSEDVLLQVLATYRSTLTQLELDKVRLYMSRSEWSGVLSAILQMPVLESLGLIYLRLGRHRRSVLMVLPGSGSLKSRAGNRVQGRPWMAMDGRDVVIAGLRELLSKPLTYV